MSAIKQILNTQWITYKFHSYKHISWSKNYAEEASIQLGVDIARIFKTLILEWDGIFYCCVVWWNQQLDLKKMANIVWAKKMILPLEDIVKKQTGYIFGWVSPIGQKKKIITYIDIDCNLFDTIYVSAGSHWKELEISPKDLIFICEWIREDIKQTKV